MAGFENYIKNSDGNDKRQGSDIAVPESLVLTSKSNSKPSILKGSIMKNIGIKVGVAAVVILVLAYFLAIRPFLAIKAKANVLIASAKDLKATFAKNNIDLLNSKLDEFTGQYKDFENSAKSVYWAVFIPYISDFKNLVEAGDYLLRAAKESVVAITPYADLIGFKKGATSFVERSAEDRLQTAVLTLDKVLTKLDPIAADIEQAQIRVEKINPAIYPKSIGKTVVRDRIQNIKDSFSGLTSLFVDAKPLVKALPQIFGENKEQVYLILFQNDKELRATGGFLTSYAIFRIKNGKIRIERSEDIYSLDNSIAVHPVAPREILAYHKDVNQFYIRDSNLSPDFPTSVDLFNSLFSKSSEKINYDGIITIDSRVLVDMLNIFGDTEVDGITFSARNDKRCNCAQVLYTLFDLVDRPTPYIKANRKGILGDLMYALFYKAIGFSPSKYWGTLAQQMFTNLQEKHILLYFTDPELEKSVDKLNFAGRVRDYSGDFLYINNVNFAGAKSNMFVSESITSKTESQNGKLVRNVTIEFRNPFPPSDCNLERGGLCLNAILRDWIRFYVPKGSTLTSFQGSEKKVQTYDELGKTVFEGFLEVPTQGIARATVSYTLPGNISEGNYSLLIEKQPGTDNQKLKVDFNGNTLFNGILDVDHEVKSK